jgi:uncharacterized protein YbbC (DUF1343 family)
MIKNGRIKTGSECLNPESWSGEKLGVVMHPASINSRFNNIFEQLLEQGCEVVALFGPQHGIFGETQDNMIEWEGYEDPESGIPIYSLYGKHRTPTREMLKGVGRLVIDLQDIGARYYTFIWTMMNCMKAAFRQGIPVSILDRPNPIGSRKVQGPILDMDYTSFVGLAPIPVRHGLTIGEMALFLKNHFEWDGDLEVVPMEGYRRDMLFRETGLPWIFPSPNMPKVETAMVYPGGCLLEATNISEARGTTLPFELVGAPFIHAKRLLTSLKKHELPGVYFREVHFQPTFHKWSGEVCNGCHVHITDPDTFRPFDTYAALIYQIATLWPDRFEWLDPPYEYEYEKMPIDILAGNSEFREMVDSGGDLLAFLNEKEREAALFVDEVTGIRIYE